VSGIKNLFRIPVNRADCESYVDPADAFPYNFPIAP
jgi:hypothetical protein